ncbi:hypothetical protein D3C87_1091790 [compost metagenome]
MRRVARRHRTIFGEHRIQPGQALQCGIGTVAVIAIDDAVENLHLTGGFVLNAVLHRHRHDFIIEQTGGLCLSGALLTLQSVQILFFAADVVTASDDFGGLTHREIDARHLLLEQRVDQVVGVDAFHGQADGLDAAGDDDVAATRSDLVGGNGDGLQARRAETVEGHAGGADAQPRKHRDVATDVVALGAFIGAGADDAILDTGRVDAGTRQQGVDAMRGHVVRTGLVELAAKGFGQAGPHAVDDHHFTHGIPHCCCRLRVDRA